MSNYAIHTGQNRTVTLGGTSYIVAQFGPASIGRLNAWIKSQFPDPRVEGQKRAIAFKDLPELAKHVWEEAVNEARLWPPTIDDTVGQTALFTHSEGIALLVYTALGKHNGSITRDRAAEIAETITIEEVGAIFAAMLPEGLTPPKEDQGETVDLPISAAKMPN